MSEFPRRWHSWRRLIQRAIKHPTAIPHDRLMHIRHAETNGILRPPKPMKSNARAAANLILLYPTGCEEENTYGSAFDIFDADFAVDDVCFPLTRRARALRKHSGEISLPGGKFDDSHDIDLIDTALRETSEELGIGVRRIEGAGELEAWLQVDDSALHDGVEVFGSLQEVYIPTSNFIISPIVAAHRYKRYSANTINEFRFNEHEVDEVVMLSLTRLLTDTTSVGEEIRELHGYRVRVPFFTLPATATTTSTTTTDTTSAPPPHLGNTVVWGATALVMSEFVERVRRQLQLEGPNSE